MTRTIYINVTGKILGEKKLKMLLDTLDRRIGEGYGEIGLDLSEASSMDYEALSAVMVLRKRLHDEGKILWVSQASPSVEALLRKLRLDELLEK